MGTQPVSDPAVGPATSRPNGYGSVRALLPQVPPGQERPGARLPPPQPGTGGDDPSHIPSPPAAGAQPSPAASPRPLPAARAFPAEPGPVGAAWSPDSACSWSDGVQQGRLRRCARAMLG
ncbi:putative Ras GTPase-activating protein 4B [Platysternon megacephalum]|uniref:Putative Ras GTPase-activating protein 4B n=1 Tax=Platysternon megacephalum TaxID=55544 RepID=A0A4D9F6Z8_9SAUR|nr:putative Ras GTPase-activating protein 4B [Platysternon megacephalum]